MASRATRLTAIWVFASGCFLEFILFVVFPMTPQLATSNALLWLHTQWAWWGAGVFFAFFTLLSIAIWFSETILTKVLHRNPPATPPSMAPAPTPPVPIVVSSQIGDRIIVDASPDDLLKFFKDNLRIQAQSLLQPYIGQWMMIRDAEVRDVSHPHPEMLIVTTKKDVYLMFNAEWKQRVSVLRKDSKITVIGQIKGVSFGQVDLEKCEIISS